MAKAIMGLEGQTFGCWTVLDLADKSDDGKVLWRAECPKGHTRVCALSDLRKSARRKSCLCRHPGLLSSKLGKTRQENQ